MTSLFSKSVKMIPKPTRRILNNASDRLFRARDLVLADQTPYEIIHDNGLVKLRHYFPLSEDTITLDGQPLPVNKKTHKTPLVIVPPLAVNMLIYDLFPDRSLVKYFLARGFDVYLIDWGMPTRKHAHYNLVTYVCELMPEFLAKIREHSGQRQLSLHGWSMGGVFTLCYTALTHDPDIRNLVILGTPINSHASGAIGKVYQFIERRAEWVRQNTGFRIHNLNPQWLHTPGWINVVSFKMTNPIGSLMGYWELVVKLADRQFVINHATTSAFLDKMVAYPGGIVQDMMVRIWIDNELAKGYMQLGNSEVRLSDIQSALFAAAGKSDNMVTKAAVETLMEHVSSKDKIFEVVAGGHMGILSGSKAPQDVWPKVANWLAERSN
ncbi:alpha/beta fold hydrolase [Agitococcus lubricus]|uniref:Polyhydroxyalkanoate synthase n=1 Tax=Agitococcus lubricus TaxID=1077255 RepID=A0A2T5IYQ9_9GAMM|nr:alpha/beta fold hydrolase [Agitococcus lubricus]PTQ89155.1 polyhydroxyalkanoate synthase [Agitococcus lubricus]